MQPGHPESWARLQTATSVDPMRWAQSVLQGQCSWLTINTPPWHPSLHTQSRNAICSPTHSNPTPHFSMPNSPPACLAHPTESINLDDNILLTIANASQLANHIVSQHPTAHPALSTRPGLVLLMSVWLPFLALVHPLFVICWRALFIYYLISCARKPLHFLCTQTPALRNVFSWAWM